MIKRIPFWLLTTVLLTAASVDAQQAAKIPLIAFLSGASATDARNIVRIDTFRQALRGLGYVERKNLNIEYRYAEGKENRLPELADELVRLKPEVIVVATSSTARVVKKFTSIIPIVMTSAADPTIGGLIASLARPGGNVTGLTSYSQELLGKRLELLKETFPKISRIGFLNDAGGTLSKSMFTDAQGAAKILGVQFQLVEIRTSNPDIEGSLRAIGKEHLGALITSPSPPILFRQSRIVKWLEQNRVPAMHPDQEWTNVGGLMSYGANVLDLYRRAAVYVDKILKGSKPTELPVEQPIKFEFVINLKAAKAINVTIPQSVLYRADKVIR